MSKKAFDSTTQKALSLVAGALALVIVYAAASEAGWLGMPMATTPPVISQPLH